MNRKRNYFLLFMFATVVFVACRKDGVETGTLRMRLQDSPSDVYQQVNIDVQGVDVFNGTSDASGQWTSLQITPGIYDLLTLENGLDVLIADHEIPIGFISQIRLDLGTNNSLMVNNTVYPMDVPSGNTSGLKINVHEMITTNRITEIYLDFDAQHSIVVNGNGSYSLKPVIRAFTLNSTGGVSGTTNVTAPGMTATLVSGNDSYATTVDAATGYFMIRGAKAGTYSLVIDAPSMTRPMKVNGIDVTIGTINDIGVVNLPL